MKLSRIGLPDVKSLVMVVAGNFLYALIVKLFLLPANLAIGGTNGVAMMIDHFFGISISGFVDLESGLWVISYRSAYPMSQKVARSHLQHELLLYSPSSEIVKSGREKHDGI